MPFRGMRPRFFLFYSRCCLIEFAIRHIRQDVMGCCFAARLFVYALMRVRQARCFCCLAYVCDVYFFIYYSTPPCRRHMPDMSLVYITVRRVVFHYQVNHAMRKSLFYLCIRVPPVCLYASPRPHQMR